LGGAPRSEGGRGSTPLLDRRKPFFFFLFPKPLGSISVSLVVGKRRLCVGGFFFFFHNSWEPLFPEVLRRGGGPHRYSSRGARRPLQRRLSLLFFEDGVSVFPGSTPATMKALLFFPLHPRERTFRAFYRERGGRRVLPLNIRHRKAMRSSFFFLFSRAPR